MTDKQIERELLNAVNSINNLSGPMKNIPLLFEEVTKIQDELEKIIKTLYRGNGEKALITTLATHSREHEHADKRMSSHQEQIDWLRDTVMDHMHNDIHDRKENTKIKKVFSNKVKLTLLSAVTTLLGGIAVKYNWPEITTFIIERLQ